MQQPYDDVFGIKSIWDLRTPEGKAVRIERCAQGLNNRLFRVRFNGDVFSCKLFLEDERRRHYREWVALTTLEQAGETLAPEPLLYAPSGPLPHPTIVSRWVPSVPLANSPLSEEDASALIAAVNRLHSIPVPNESAMLAAWHQPASFAEYAADLTANVARIQSWLATLDADAARLPGFAAELPSQLLLIEQAERLALDAVSAASGTGSDSPPALVRADGNLDGIVRDDLGQIRFMDWDHSGIGDAALDLAELRWHPRSLATPPAHWQSAIDSYLPRPDDDTFAERLSVYDRLVPSAWVARSAILLMEGIAKSSNKRRQAATPSRLYRTVKTQLNHYFVALGLLEAEDGTPEDVE